MDSRWKSKARRVWISGGTGSFITDGDPYEVSHDSTVTPRGQVMEFVTNRGETIKYPMPLSWFTAVTQTITLGTAISSSQTFGTPTVTRLFKKSWELDFSTPSIQLFPTSSLVLASLLAGAPTASHIWTFQETSGSYLDVLSNGADLVEKVAMTERPSLAFGFYDGTNISSMTDRKCLELQENTTRYQLESSSSFQVGASGSGQSFGMLVVFRAGTYTAAVRSICGTQNNTAPNVGWEFRTTADGDLRVQIDEGDVTDTANITVGHCEGGWHVALFAIDRSVSNGEIRMYSDIASGSSTLSSVTASTDSGHPFRFGDCNLLASRFVQIAYAAAFTGSQVARITGLGNFWTHGRDPSFRKLSTYTRTSHNTDLVGTSGTFGDCVTTWWGNESAPTVAPQVWLGKQTSFTSDNKFGLASFKPYRNRILNSEQFNSTTEWINNGLTITQGHAFSPHGFHIAQRLNANVNGESVRYSGALGLVQGGVYNASFWGRMNVSATTMSLGISESTGSTTIAYSQNYILNDTTWRRYNFSWTHTGSHDGHLYIFPGTQAGQGDAVIWGVQVTTGSTPLPYVRGYFATAAAFPSSSLVTALTASAITFDAGTVSSSFVLANLHRSASSYNAIWTVTGSSDGRILYASHVDNRFVGLATDASDNLLNTTNPAVVTRATGVFYAPYFKWDNRIGIRTTPSSSIDVAFATSSISRYTASFTYNSHLTGTIQIGSNELATVGTALDGYIEKVMFWSGADGLLELPIDGGSPSGSVLVPTKSEHFTMLKETPLDYLWLCQDKNGDLSPTLGGVTLSENGAGNKKYEQTITDWSRFAVGSEVDASTMAWRTSAGPDPSAESVAWIGLFKFPSLPAGTRAFMAAKGASPQIVLQITNGGLFRFNVNGVSVDGVYNYVDGKVHPVVISYNRTLGTVEFLTDKERVSGTYDAGITAGNAGIGHTAGGSTALFRCLWLGAAEGTSAERDWKQFLQRLHWPLAY